MSWRCVMLAFAMMAAIQHQANKPTPKKKQFARLLKCGLTPSSSKDRPKPIVAKAREPPRRGGANEDRRNEAGGAREGHERSG